MPASGHNRIHNLLGNTYGQLVVEGLVPIQERKKHTRAEWVCLCACGQRKIFRGDQLECGKAISCGCASSAARSANMKQIRAKYGAPCALPMWEEHGMNCDASGAARRAYAFESRLWSKYGLTFMAYCDLADAQDFKCPVCTDTLSMDRNTHIDHDHATGKVRGLLCASCNTAIGHLQDSKDNMARAIQYLNTNE